MLKNLRSSWAGFRLCCLWNGQEAAGHQHLRDFGCAISP